MRNSDSNCVYFGPDHSVSFEGTLDRCDHGSDPIGQDEYRLRIVARSDDDPTTFDYWTIIGPTLTDVRGLTFGKRYRLTLTEVE